MSPLAETLNNPSLVATAAATTVAILPSLQRAILQEHVSLPVILSSNLLLYVINFIAARQPGRIDGIQVQEITQVSKTATNKERKQLHDDRELIELFLPQRGKSLVAPSGWAFIIWAPIFLGEMLFTLVTPILPSSTAMVLRQVSTGFMGAQVFQSLWAASFRPKYARSNAIFLSGILLSCIAGSLSIAHRGYARLSLPLWQYMLCCFPITLHFGWTTAATLVNWNGTIAAKFADKYPRSVAW